jgi:signal transduction histidine kinase
MRRLSARVLRDSDLASITRHLTIELPLLLAAPGATLLLWDRRLETFDQLELSEGRLRRSRAKAAEASAARPRWLLSEGNLLETTGDGGDGILVPLLARSGLVGTLSISAPAAVAAPLSREETRLVSRIAFRAALALENHAYQRELIASERLAALGTFAGMLAHDFRGPMTVIRGYAETLLHPEVSPEEVRSRAALIIDATDRLSRMTDETLDYARAGERLTLRPVSLGTFVNELAAVIQLELPGLTVERDLCVGPGLRVHLDVDKLRRAVGNIAANACEAMGGKGRLLVHARVESRLPALVGPPMHLVIEMADEGPGVPPEIAERVFEPFVTVGKKRGTGLGLAVARRFVEDHGGSLELLPPPTPPAHGACFRITLPLERRNPDAPR